MTGKFAMYTIRGLGKAPDLNQIAKLLKVSAEDIDPDFGVISLDSEQSLYCIRADCRKVRSSFGPSKQYEGPWADPEILEATSHSDRS
jgi:hypothetical protein